MLVWLLPTGVRVEGGAAATRQGGARLGREVPQVFALLQVVPVVTAAHPTLARSHQHPQVPVQVLRQDLQAALARAAASAHTHR